jgi:hypothetical protein
MGAYSYTEQEIASIIRAHKRFRLRFCTGAATILFAACVVAALRPEWIFGAHQHARTWVITALGIFFVGPLSEHLRRWKNGPRKLQMSLQATRVEISEDGVGRTGSKRLERSEILRAEELSWGLYLRTANRYRWLMIPARIGGYSALKRELEQWNIPIVAATSAPNWEEFAGVFVFIATMLCAIFAHSIAVLAASLAIASLVAVAGFIIISANPDNLPKMRWARLGIFLPVFMNASMLWMALRP